MFHFVMYRTPDPAEAAWVASRLGLASSSAEGATIYWDEDSWYMIAVFPKPADHIMPHVVYFIRHDYSRGRRGEPRRVRREKVRALFNTLHEALLKHMSGTMSLPGPEDVAEALGAATSYANNYDVTIAFTRSAFEDAVAEIASGRAPRPANAIVHAYSTLRSYPAFFVASRVYSMTLRWIVHLVREAGVPANCLGAVQRLAVQVDLKATARLAKAGEHYVNAIKAVLAMADADTVEKAAEYAAAAEKEIDAFLRTVGCERVNADCVYSNIYEIASFLSRALSTECRAWAEAWLSKVREVLTERVTYIMTLFSPLSESGRVLLPGSLVYLGPKVFSADYSPAFIEYNRSIYMAPASMGARELAKRAARLMTPPPIHTMVPV